MAVDKLVDSTQLDTDLTSVANAIRTKGGTSAQLAFPADFVSAIAAIPTGGGIRNVTGAFTMVTRGRAPNIVHNLGTKKVACIIYPISQINADRGYDTFYSAFLNVNEIIPDDSWLLDFTSYNNYFTGVATITKAERNQNLRSGAMQQSPWQTQNTWYKATSVTTETAAERIVSDNEITCGTTFWAAGTYAYIVMALE